MMDRHARTLAKLSPEMVLPHVYIEHSWLVFWSEKESRHLYVKPHAKILKLWKRGLHCNCCLEPVDHFILIRSVVIQHRASCTLIPVIRDNFNQPYPLTIDHIKPRSRGGTDHQDNLQLLCSRCNGIKSNQFLSIEKLRLLVTKTEIGTYRCSLPQREDIGIRLVQPTIVAMAYAGFPSLSEALAS